MSTSDVKGERSPEDRSGSGRKLSQCIDEADHMSRGGAARCRDVDGIKGTGSRE